MLRLLSADRETADILPMTCLLKLTIALAWLCLLQAFAIAANHESGSSSPTPSAAPACSDQQFRQFDFWVGKWIVRNPEGKEVGTSEISRQSAGCAIREQWTSASGAGGMSINYFDASDGLWHQDWVGADGTILHLLGGLQGEVMVLNGESKHPRGVATNRISYTPLGGGKVKQEWAISADGGKSWQTSFVGIYEPKA